MKVVSRPVRFFMVLATVFLLIVVSVASLALFPFVAVGVGAWIHWKFIVMVWTEALLKVKE